MRTLSSLIAVMLLAGCSYLPSWAGGKDAPEERLKGSRIAVMDVGTELAADPSVSDASINLPESERNPDWQQEPGIGSQPQNLKLSGLTQRISASIGDGNDWQHELVTAPVVAGGRVFAMDAEGVISAHDAQNPEQIIWISEAAKAPDDAEIVGGGLAAVGPYVFVTTGYGQVMALKAEDGSVIWKQWLRVPVRAAPRLEQGSLLVLTVNNEISAYEAATGALQWQHQSASEGVGFLGMVAPAAADGTVVAPYSSSDIEALSLADGKPLWSESLLVARRTSATDILTGIDANPIIHEGRVYAVSNSGLLMCSQLVSGRSIWEQPIAAHQTPWLAGDFLFVIDTDQQLIALHKDDGRIRWVIDLKDQVTEPEKDLRFYGPVVVNNVVAVVSSQGELLTFAPDSGARDQLLEIPDNVRAPPVVAGGVMYLVEANATLHALY